MQALNYIILATSMFFLYWCTSTAYHKVVYVTPIESLPVFHKQNCLITRLEIKEQDKSLEDLSIYYSGTNQAPPQLKIKNEEEVDNRQIMDVVRSREVIQTDKPQTSTNPSKKDQDKVKKTQKTESQQKKAEKQPAKRDDDDSFKPSKKTYKSSNSKKSSVFDVLE